MKRVPRALVEERVHDARRRARRAACPACQREVWTGLDDDVCAGSAVADVDPIDEDTALICFDNGVPIYGFDVRQHLWSLPSPRHGYRITLRAHTCSRKAAS